MNMITPYMICDKCKCQIVTPSSSIASSTHEPDICELGRWRNIEASKYGMVGISGHATAEWTLSYICTELTMVYPKVASKVLKVTRYGLQTINDIFVEEWAARGIEIFIKNNGFAGMTLATFLDKMVAERHNESGRAQLRDL